MMTTSAKLDCKAQVQDKCDDRLDQLQTMLINPDSSEFYEFGLSFEYVPGTDENPEGYFRYLMSWGGPADEFRFFVGPDYRLYKVEYWFLDWFDGAKVTLSPDMAVIQDTWTQLTTAISGELDDTENLQAMVKEAVEVSILQDS